MNLWVSYYDIVIASFWLVIVSAFSGESLGELPIVSVSPMAEKLKFQHSLVNLWVSYGLLENVKDLRKLGFSILW